ncbi:MAG: Helix-turn-helix domain protein [Clostridia bacterium 62_21]|nr:MAG: Helix-turn-helix domain protein [Clostridia bacterium 62_21]HAG07908.1 XRE family transcriptional regulator [Peptococcaceae bacterium]
MAETLGERLAALRREKGISQAELARLLNLGQSTIAMYERDRRTPDPLTLRRLADFFGVSVDYLLGRTPERAGPPEGTARAQPAAAAEATPAYTADPLFGPLLARLPHLTEEERQSLAEFWAWALRVIEKERDRRRGGAGE